MNNAECAELTRRLVRADPEHHKWNFFNGLLYRPQPVLEWRYCNFLGGEHTIWMLKRMATKGACPQLTGFGGGSDKPWQTGIALKVFEKRSRWYHAASPEHSVALTYIAWCEARQVEGVDQQQAAAVSGNER